MAALSPQDQFQRALGVVSAQFKKKKISVRFGPTGKMRFVIDEASLKDALVSSGVDEGLFRGIFDDEIGPLLEATVRGGLEQYIDAYHIRQGPESDAKALAAQKSTLADRAKLVQTAILDSELTGRYLIKKTSKHPRLKRSEWEVASKSSLSAEEREPVRPYATLTFETIRPEPSVGVLAWFPFFPSESIGKADFCTFDCDEGDLDDLIKALQDARAALVQAIDGGAAHGR